METVDSLFFRPFQGKRISVIAYDHHDLAADLFFPAAIHYGLEVAPAVGSKHRYSHDFHLSNKHLASIIKVFFGFSTELPMVCLELVLFLIV